MLLSAALITLNEEGQLPGCLSSVQPFVDEIVIYDTGSTDATVEIAREAGATVIEGEWRNDFAWARNQGLAACHGDWILRIDADERAHGTPRFVRGQLAKATTEELFALPLLINNNDLFAPCTTSLFRRDRYAYSGAVHEVLWPPSATAPTLPGLYLRAVREPNRASSLERNLRLALEAIGAGHHDPLPGRLELLAAMTLAGMGRVEEGRMWMERGISALPPRESRPDELGPYIILLLATCRARGLSCSPFVP